MKKAFFILFIILGLISFISMRGQEAVSQDYVLALYNKPISEWPKPQIDSGIAWSEFRSLPKVDTSYFALMEQPDIKLGKFLFLTRSYPVQIKYHAAAATTHKHRGQTN